MKSSARVTGLLMACILAAAASAQGSVSHDGLSQSLVRQGYADLAPGICLLNFSLEITNPNNGQVSKRETNALGLIISEEGLVLTHGHMQLENRQPENIRVTVDLLGDRQEYTARLLKKPDDINVCFLQIDMDEDDPAFTPVRFTPDYEPSLGEPVLLMGILARSLDYMPNAIGRRIGAILSEPRTTYCLDEAVPFGYVGGPVLNTAGELIGVVGFDMTSAEGGDVYTRSGHPLLYQTDLFQNYIDTPPSEEDIEKERDDAWFGVFTQPLTNDFAEYWDLPQDGGIVVATVIAGSPADEAGFQMGDVIIVFDGHAVNAKQDRDVAGFTKMVRESALNEALAVEFYRDGEQSSLEVALTNRPKSARDAEEYEDEVFGFTVREITRDVHILLNLADDVHGVLVRKVKSGSAANLAGIPPNSIVMAFDDRQIANIEDFQTAIEALENEKPAEIAVLCRVGNRTGFFRMQPRWE